MFASLALFLGAASLVHGAATPTSPDSTTVAAIGSTLKTQWVTDKTGTWTDMTIQLMTGDNYHMVPLTTVGSGIDATQESDYSFTVPEVTPTSAIYFLQFTPAGNASDVQWTTRFTISGTDGSVSDPTNSTQPGGAAIPWGTGSLASGSDASSSEASSASSSVSASSSAAASSSVSKMSSAMSSASATSTKSSSGSAMNAAQSATSAAAAAASSTVATSSGNKVIGGAAGAALVGLVGLAFTL